MKVSVALCTFNGEQFIQQQLDSILDQTNPVDEIIVCDDGSADETFSLLQKIASANKQVQLFRNDQTLGVVKNFEKAIELCTGDVIFFADQDDVWKHYKVEQTLNYFNENEDKLAVFTNAELIDDNHQLTGKTLWETLLFSPQNSPASTFEYLLNYRNIITGACLAIRRKAIEIILPFVSNSQILHDEWIGLKLGSINGIGYIDKSLLQYRIHSRQQTKSIWLKSAKEIEERNSILEGKISDNPLLHFRHWKKRSNYISLISSLGINVENKYAEQVIINRKEALLELMKSKKSITRKWTLFKLFLRQRENISAADLLKA